MKNPQIQLKHLNICVGDELFPRDLLTLREGGVKVEIEICSLLGYKISVEINSHDAKLANEICAAVTKCPIEVWLERATEIQGENDGNEQNL